MAYATARRLAAVLTVGIAALVMAGSAMAAGSTPFGCRASTVRVTLLSSLTTEPTIANPNTTPCATDTAGVAGTTSVPVTSSSGTGTVDVGAVGAFTYSAYSTTSTAPGATAVAAVDGASVPSAGLVVAGPIQATASYECVNDQLVSSSSSTVNLIYLNGKAMPVPTGAPTTISLGGLGYIKTNQTVQTANSLTETALEINLTGIADIVIGEAKVTQSISSPCAGTAPIPPVLEICPPGSTLNIAAQLCEIVITNPNGTTTIIVVSRPFQGPSGGTVYPTSVVAKKYKGFPCTTGPGPKFALVATKRGGRVFGTPKSDRILALGRYERVAGLGGNDCIDGNGGSQKIFDGNGKDKIYSGPFSNRIAVGNGNDYINGRNGSGDWITAGNGQDHVYGAKGKTRIDVGIGRDFVYGGPAKNRIWAGAHNAFVSCGSGKHNLAFLRDSAVSFAKRHGCQTIRLLH
jgi:hypothetical protein